MEQEQAEKYSSTTFGYSQNSPICEFDAEFTAGVLNCRPIGLSSDEIYAFIVGEKARSEGASGRAGG